MARSPRTRWAKHEVKLADLVLQARELRGQGLTYEAIGKIQGCGRRTAERRVKRGLAKQLDESAEDARKLMLGGMDADEHEATRIIEANRAAALRGKVLPARIVLAAIETRCKVRDRRAKLLGLDAPEKHEHTGKDGGPIEIDGAHDDLLGRLARLAALAAPGAGDPKPEPN